MPAHCKVLLKLQAHGLIFGINYLTVFSKLSEQEFASLTLSNFFTDTTPNVKRKSSLNETDVELKPEGKDIGEKSSFGGSQGSLNSTSSSSFTATDNPEQFESQKQIKEVMEQGIEK